MFVGDAWTVGKGEVRILPLKRILCVLGEWHVVTLVRLFVSALLKKMHGNV